MEILSSCYYQTNINKKGQFVTVSLGPFGMHLKDRYLDLPHFPRIQEKIFEGSIYSTLFLDLETKG